MSEVLKPTGRHVIRLPNGRVCTVATYCASWRMLKTLPDNAQIRGFEHFAEDAGRIRRELMRGLHDRINRHVAGYGVGRKWSSDWFWSAWRCAREVNAPRLAVHWVPLDLRGRLAHRVSRWED